MAVSNEPTREELYEIIAAQQKMIDRLTAEVTALRSRVEELEEQLNKNSRNSSKPPSTDGFDKPAPKSQRKKSGKKAGGQNGHKGHHMALDSFDRTERIYPSRCANCPHRAECGKLRVYYTCYATDVIVQKETVRYQMMECNCDGVHAAAKRPAGINGTVTYGNNLKALICVLSTKGMVAMKNLCEIVEGLTGIRPSEGTVVNMLRSAAMTAESVVSSYPQRLNKIPVVHSDETGIYINGTLHWVHVVCTRNMTYYALSKKRGTKAMYEIDFLPNYHGIVVHDFWKSYFKVTEAKHAMCGAHLLRELTGIYENHPEQTWARDMYHQLLDMCRAADFYNQNPDIGSREQYMDCMKRAYDEIVERASAQNPLPVKAQGKKGRPKRGKIRALIDRLREYKDDICRFADNALVPFTNNQAERDLRMIKVKNKVIGCFRSLEGARNFLTLKSFTSTSAKNGVTAFQALIALFSGQVDSGTE